MKSSNEQLKNRGYATIEDIDKYVDLNENELLVLLNSKEPHKRTIAIKLLSNKAKLDNEIINLFCNMLLHENKLYTKIELCNALQKVSVESAKIMVNYLGVIGKNQYKKLPDQKFNKKSYPIPRDIVARTLAHMGVEVLPEVIKVLKSNNKVAIREALDAIGFICFYNSKAYREEMLNDLISSFNKYNEDDIIRWKLVRAFESFNNQIIIDLLTNIKENDEEEIIRIEAKRSLNVIKNRIK
jgi:HEAT repeat protein